MLEEGQGKGGKEGEEGGEEEEEGGERKIERSKTLRGFTVSRVLTVLRVLKILISHDANY